MHDYAVSQPNRIRVLSATASQYLPLFSLSLPGQRFFLFAPFPATFPVNDQRKKCGTGNSPLFRTYPFYISRWTAIRLYQRGRGDCR
jgi:hypothetical protein